jgi:hypothetical protein
MMTQRDRTDSKQDYYARRAVQERALADRAQDPGARRIHVDLAKRYTEIVAGEPVT